MTPPTWRRGLDELLPRERELLDAYIELGRHTLVAESMHLSVSSVRNMASAILRVLEVNSIAQACVLYDRSRRT